MARKNNPNQIRPENSVSKQEIVTGNLFYLLSLFFFLSLFQVPESAQAQSRPGNTEIGIILGEPTGISLKKWQSSVTAFDAALAWSFGKNESVLIHASYLYHSPLEVDQGDLYFYYGLGARAIFSKDPIFGARIPVGLQYILPSSRLTLFFEVAPTFDLIPATRFGVNGGVGVRFFL